MWWYWAIPGIFIAAMAYAIANEKPGYRFDLFLRFCFIAVFLVIFTLLAIIASAVFRVPINGLSLRANPFSRTFFDQLFSNRDAPTFGVVDIKPKAPDKRVPPTENFTAEKNGRQRSPE